MAFKAYLGAFVACVIVLTGCGRGASTSTSLLPASAPHTVQSTASFKIKLAAPPAQTSAANRTPKYISKSTQSISLAIAPTAGCTGCSAAISPAFNLTPTSPGCVVTSGLSACTLPISLNVGAYTATIATFDGLLSSGAPTGNMLSSDQAVPFTVVAGVDNAVLLTLSGIPATSAFSLSAGFPASLVGSALTIDGAGTPILVDVLMKDADGNTIVGVGSPVVSNVAVTGNPQYTATSLGTKVKITTPSSGSRVSAAISMTLTAPGCPAAPACSLALTASMTEFVGVADVDANSSQIYSERTQTWTAVPMGGAGSWSVAFDRQGTMFIANNITNAVKEFAPPYTAVTATITNGVIAPISLAIDSHGNLFVANYSGSNVAEYAPPYTAGPIATITGAAAAAPYTILVDSQDNLWIANDLTSSPAYYLPAPITASTAQALSGATNAEGLAQDTSGSVDFSSASDNHIHTYSTSGTLVSSSGIGESFRVMTALPNGAAYGTGVIGSAKIGGPASALVDITNNVLSAINSNGGNPRGVATDAQKTLFIGDNGNGTISTLAYPYTGAAQLLSNHFSSPLQIAVWP